MYDACLCVIIAHIHVLVCTHVHVRLHAPVVEGSVAQCAGCVVYMWPFFLCRVRDVCEGVRSARGGGGEGAVLMVADGRQMEPGDLVAAYAGGMVREWGREGGSEEEGGREREGLTEGMREREGGMEGGREGRMDGQTEGMREREGGREGGSRYLPVPCPSPPQESKPIFVFYQSYLSSPTPPSLPSHLSPS